MEQVKPRRRFLPPNRPLPRLGSEEELEVLSRDAELLFRGKHVVDARGLVGFISRAQHIPGLNESAERINDFFQDPECGNWVEGSALFRVARTDQGNRLKRLWRDFDHRRTTLRQYLRTETTSDGGSDCIRFKLPEARLENPKAFLSAFRHLIAGLDRISRLLLDEGFSIGGFRERSGWILLRPESDEVLDLATELFGHFRWFREQTEDVQRLENRKSISDEYSKAAKSLASAQLRHLRVLVEQTVRDRVENVSDERFEKLVTTATEYIGVLATLVNEGAEIAAPRDAEAKSEAA